MSKLPPPFLKTAKICGLDHLVKNKGHFYVEKNKVLSYDYPAGVEMTSEETAKGVQAKVVIKKGTKVKEPLFFCFGMLGEHDEQLLLPDIVVEDGAEVDIVAHCTFPNSDGAKHNMVSKFLIGKKAKLGYSEQHYHGTKSGITVVPNLEVEVDDGGEFRSNFILSKGTVGKTHIEVKVTLADYAKTQIETKVLGVNNKDDITIIDKVYMNGKGSRSLIKMRAAAKGGGKVLMQGETYANGDGASGHLDCQEIVVGKGSVAKAVPVVEVGNENARVTHEASVGKINQKELETLMTRGLSEDEATEMIIEAMMR